jgi:flagellar L-ring protein precursor FlgH
MMHTALRLIAPAALAVLATGCATLNPPPPVDLLTTAPPPVAATPRPSGSATGSLFHAASYRPAFEDRRARLVGDIVTIQIVEKVTAKQNSTSSIDRSSDTSAGISAFPFVGAGKLGKLNLGATSNNTFTGSISTTVIEVLPNGHLVVAGEKQIGVNENVDVLRFSGTVDPRALQPGSVIASTQVANARLQSRGRGAQSEAQAMGWLSRAFNSVAPF